MAHSYRDQVLAFAGIWQAVYLVQQIARTGHCDNDDLATCLNSLFVTDPKDTDEVYGNVKALTAGLELLLDQFGDASDRRDMELTKYVISVLHLERRMAKTPGMLYKIGNEIDATKTQLEHFPATHENVIAHLADIYKETISTIPPKVIVQGEQGYLSQENNASKVRALLLAAVRSAVLWYQLGGRRLTLMLSRRKLLNQTKQLLNETY